MLKNYRLNKTLILAVCCAGIILVCRRVDRKSFETVDQYSVGMGYGLCLQDGLLCATTNDGVDMFEVDRDHKLKHLRSIDLGAANFTVLVKDSTLFVGGESGITAVNLSADGSYQVVNRCGTAGTFIHKMRLREALLYVSDYYKGLSVIDISDLEHCHLIGRYDLAAGSRDLAILGDILYLANVTTGLEIFDITDPTQPNHITTAESSSGARSILLKRDTLYLGTVTSGVKLYDIADARDPRFLRGILGTEDITAFHSENGMLYCSRQNKGINIYMVGDNVEPVEVAYFNTGLSHGALVHDGLVYFVGRSVYVLGFVK